MLHILEDILKDQQFPQLRCNARKISVSKVTTIRGRCGFIALCRNIALIVHKCAKGCALMH